MRKIKADGVRTSPKLVKFLVNAPYNAQSSARIAEAGFSSAGRLRLIELGLLGKPPRCTCS